MKGPVISFLWVIAVASLPAHAVEPSDFNAKTTRNLYNLCSVTTADQQYEAAMGFCLGFVDGALDYHRALTSGDLVVPITCPGDMTTRQEIVEAFLAWARKNESLLDTESPIQGLMRSASATWPCP